jgi:hypothetical protein
MSSQAGTKRHRNEVQFANVSLQGPTRSRTGQMVQAGPVGRSSNEEMQLTKPDGLLVGGRGDPVRCRRAIVFQSGFAADLRCSADLGEGGREHRGSTVR